MISRENLKVCLIISAMFLLSACKQESHQDLVTFVNDAYKDQKPEIEPLPPIVPYEEFIYEASDLPDPFSRDNVLAGSEGEEFDWSFEVRYLRLYVLRMVILFLFRLGITWD